VRTVFCVALAVALSGCSLMGRAFPITRNAVQKVWGSQNELLVRAVASVDQAWFVPGKGLVLFGEVTPGRMIGDPLRMNPNDDPPTAPYVAALSLRELDSRRPRLHYERFHAAKAGDVACVRGFAPSVELVATRGSPMVVLVDPKDTTLRQIILDQQQIYVGQLPGMGDANLVRLGPRGGDWLWTLALPFTFVADLARLPFRGVPPVRMSTACAELEQMLFPRVAPLPVRAGAQPMPPIAAAPATTSAAQTSTAPATRSPQTPNQPTFSTSTKTDKPAITQRLITPPANNKSIKAQQQPTQ
jgi:hypothetical protein